MASRRRITIKRVRAIAAELPPKSIELETRVGRLEMHMRDVREAIDVLLKRTAAVQAQLDHLAARITRI